MSAQILDGKIISAQLEAELKLRVDAMAAQGNIPGLTVILTHDARFRSCIPGDLVSYHVVRVLRILHILRILRISSR